MTDVKQKPNDQEKLDKLNNMYKTKTVYIPRKVAREQLERKLGSVFDLFSHISFRLNYGINTVVSENIPNIMKKVFDRKQHARQELPNKIRSIVKFFDDAPKKLSESNIKGTEATAQIFKKLKTRKKQAREELVEKLKNSVKVLIDADNKMKQTWNLNVTPDFTWRLNKSFEYAFESAEKSVNKYQQEVHEKKEKKEERVNKVVEKREVVQNFFGSIKENLAESTSNAMSKLQGKLSVLLAESIKKNILEPPQPKVTTGEAHRTVSPSATNYQSILPMGSNIATKNSINSMSPTIQNDTVTYEARMDSPDNYNKPQLPEPKRIKTNKAQSTSVPPKNYTDFEVQAGNGMILEKHLKSKKGEPKPSDPTAVDKPTQQTQFQKYESIRDIEFKSSPQKRQNHSLQKDIPHLPNLEELESSRAAERLREKEKSLRLGFEKNLSEAISRQIEKRSAEFVSARPSGKKTRIEDEETQAVKYYFEFKRRIKQKVNFHEMSNNSHNQSAIVTDNSLPPISGHQRDFSSDEYRSYRKPKKMLNGSPLTNRPYPHATRKKSNPSADYYMDNPLDKSQLLNASYVDTPNYPSGSNRKKYHINSPTPIRSNGIEFEFYTPPKIVTHDAKSPGYPVYSDKKSKFEAEIPRYFNKPLNYSPFEAPPRKPFVPKREDYLPRKQVNKWKANYNGQIIGYNEVVKQSEEKAKYDRKIKDEMAMWAV